MKKLALLLVAAFIVTLLAVSCKKDKKEESTPSNPPKPYSELIVGRWKTADGGHFEVYDADGHGHMWDPADDVEEEEADTFEWSIDEHKQMTQIIHFHSGAADLPQYCNILKLNSTTFKYNNEGWRAEYTLTRVTEE